MKPITRSFVPTSEAGEVHHRYARSSISAEEHFGYLVDGAEITFSDHLDYIQRSQAVENFGEVLAIDLADEPAIRAQLNAISIYSNIPGDRERQRSLFVAAERCEREPKQHHLTLSTANLDGIELIARFATTPDWVRSMRRKLREAKRKAEAVAARTGKPFKDVEVVVADLTSKEAHERLTWFDGHPCSPQPRWKQGRTGRNHYRFVGALPHGARPRERNLMLRGFVDMLARDGWMAVGVIHQPDPHADARNFHFHVDAYDRPAKWLEEHACWDFEYTVRRDGKRTFPLRQRKVNYRQEVGPEGKLEKVDTATMMRDRFIDIVNSVTGHRPSVDLYLKGTYAQNGVELTPLEHLGNRAVALERRGTATAGGLRNARRMVADDFAACERLADDRTLALERECEAARALLSDQPDALAALDRTEAFRRREIRREQEVQMADVVVAMSRSRAETVIATLSPELGCRKKSRVGDRELLASAQGHLGWVELHTPSKRDRTKACQSTSRTSRKADGGWDAVEAGVLATGSSHDQLIYVPKRTTAFKQEDPRYRSLMEGRLNRWLAKHASDASQLIFEAERVRLGAGVAPSIDTLMQRFINVPNVQRMLLVERGKRVTANTQAALLVAKPRRKKSKLDSKDLGLALPPRDTPVVRARQRSTIATTNSKIELGKPFASRLSRQAERFGYDKGDCQDFRV